MGVCATSFEHKSQDSCLIVFGSEIYPPTCSRIDYGILEMIIFVLMKVQHRKYIYANGCYVMIFVVAPLMFIRAIMLLSADLWIDVI